MFSIFLIEQSDFTIRFAVETIPSHARSNFLVMTNYVELSQHGYVLLETPSYHGAVGRPKIGAHARHTSWSMI